MTSISATLMATTATSIGKGGLLTVAGEKVSATAANTRSRALGTKICQKSGMRRLGLTRGTLADGLSGRNGGAAASSAGVAVVRAGIAAELIVFRRAERRSQPNPRKQVPLSRLAAADRPA